jgi:atypical dual specificity phosphatase
MHILHVLKRFQRTSDPGAWIVPGKLLIRSHPQREADLAELAGLGIRTVVNLSRRAHDPDRLERAGVVEVHIPVSDFSAPTPEQIERGIVAIDAALARGERVAVHCDGGLGRSGTLAACYLVHRGLDAETAISEVRTRRPGAIETSGQRAAIEAYADQMRKPT